MATFDASNSYSPLATGWERLSKSIQETEESRAASIQALMNIVADSYDEVLADHAVDYLLADLNDADFPQDLNHLLACTLDLQGLSPAAACKRIRLCAVLINHPKIRLSKAVLLDASALTASLLVKPETTTDDLSLPDMVEGIIVAIDSMTDISFEAKAEEWLWKMVLQPLLLAVSKPTTTRLKASIVFGTVCRGLDLAAACTDIPLQQIWNRCLRTLTHLPLLEVSEGFTLLRRCLNRATIQLALPQLELVLSFCLQACEHPQSSPALLCQAMTLVQQLAQAANVSLLEWGSKVTTLEAAKQAFDGDYPRLCNILQYLAQNQEKHELVRSGARKALMAVHRLFDVAAPPENERDEAPSTTTGEELSVKIEEDFTDPPIDESGAAAEDETAPKGENHITTEDAPTAKDNKKATKCLLARIKSSKKGVKKALKKCKKAAKKLFHIPASSSKAAKVSKAISEEQAQDPATPAATELAEQTAATEAMVETTEPSEEKQDLEPATLAAAVINEEAIALEAAVEEPSQAEQILEAEAPTAIIYEATAAPEAAVEEPSQAEQILEAEAPTAIIYEATAAPEAAVEEPSHAEQILEAEAPTAIIYEATAAPEAAVEESGSSQASTSPIAATIGQENTSPKAAATEKDPSPVNNKAARLSSCRRRLVHKNNGGISRTSPETATGGNRSIKSPKIPVWRPAYRVDSSSVSSQQSTKDHTRGKAQRKTATSPATPATPRSTAATVASTSAYAKRMAYTGYKDRVGAGKVNNLCRPRWR